MSGPSSIVRRIGVALAVIGAGAAATAALTGNFWSASDGEAHYGIGLLSASLCRAGECHSRALGALGIDPTFAKLAATSFAALLVSSAVGLVLAVTFARRSLRLYLGGSAAVLALFSTTALSFAHLRRPFEGTSPDVSFVLAFLGAAALLAAGGLRLSSREPTD